MSINRKYRFFLFLTFFCCLFTFSSFGQNREVLEKQKQEALKNIEEAENILNQTTQKRQASLGQLKALNKKIEAHQSLIQSISDEIKLINEEISTSQVVIEALESDLKNLKREYSDMVYAAYKSRNSYDKLAFIFSSNNFNQFVMRLRYLQQYSDSRKNQVKLINEVREQLITNKSSLESNITEKQKLLNDELDQTSKLKGLKSKQTDLVADLRSKEQKLQSDINKYKKDIDKLDKLIADLVREEIKKDKVASKDVSINLEKLSVSFEGNKNKLPWPVSSGFISEKFGTNPHPVLKRVQVPNNGVNIQTNQQEKVRAVFKGEVKSVAIIPGDFKYVVIIQHGEYFTVYARMREVYVKKGQQVDTNDIIGVVNTSSDGSTEVHFEVWKNTEKLNPEIWLAKK